MLFKRSREVVYPGHEDRHRVAIRRKDIRERVADALVRVQETFPDATVRADGLYWVADIPGVARAVFADGETLAVWMDGFAAGAVAPEGGRNV